MLIAAFRSLMLQLAWIAGLVAGSALLTWMFHGRAAALDLLDIAVVKMKAPWVWTFGWGLNSFVRSQGKLIPAVLDGVMIPNEIIVGVAARIEQSTRHRNALRYTIPITMIGILLTWTYGLPGVGIGYVLTFVAVCSIYYVAAFLLFHFVEMTLAFHVLFEHMNSIDFRRLYNPMHLENLTTYLATTTAIGLIGIYGGFRGTLTAGFAFHHELWRTFLATPLILFLPATLFYNYYPRYVLRKVLQHKVFCTMERLGHADTADARSLVSDLRDHAVLDSQILPFLDYKSLPSYLIAVFFVISLAYNSDPILKRFIKSLFEIGSP